MQRLKDCQIEGSSPVEVRYDAVLARVVEGHAGLSRVARGAFYARVRTKLIAEMRAEGRSDAIESELGVFDDAVERIEARLLERAQPAAEVPEADATKAGDKVADNRSPGDETAEDPNASAKSVEDLRRKVRAWTGRVVERGSDDDKGGIASLKPGPVEWSRSESKKSDVWLKDLLERTQEAEAAAAGRSSRPQLVRPLVTPAQMERPIPDRPVPERPMPQRPMTPKAVPEQRQVPGEDQTQGAGRSSPLSEGVKRRSGTVVPTEFRRTRDSTASRGLEKSLIGDRLGSYERSEKAIKPGPITLPDDDGEVDGEDGNSVLFYFGVAAATCIVVIMIVVGMISVSKNGRVQFAEPQAIQQTVVSPAPVAGNPVPAMANEEAPSAEDRAARAMLQRLEQWRPKAEAGEQWRPKAEAGERWRPKAEAGERWR